MKNVVKILVIGTILLSVSGCVGGPGFDQVQVYKGKDGKEMVLGYDCSALPEDQKAAALSQSHKLMTTKYLPELQERDRALQAKRSSGKAFSQEEIRDVNTQTVAFLNEVHSKTATTGCEYKGVVKS